MTLTKKMVVFIAAIIITISAVSLVIAEIGLSSMANNLLLQSLTMKVEGDIESLNTAFSKEFGQARLEDDLMVDQNGNAVKNFEFIDNFGSSLGITATVFTKQGNDFIRTITNITKNDGSRAIGTYLGTESAAYQPIMAGNLYLGTANILGLNYLTAYDPLLDGNGDLIGILYVGIPTDEIRNLAGSMSRRVMLIFIGIFIVIAIVGIVIGRIFSIRIADPIITGVELVKQLATGDLTAEIDEYLKEDKSETGDLIRAIDFTNENLKDIIGAVQISAQEIASASDELANGNQDLSSRTEKQAAALEETSASVEEMNSTIRSNTDNTISATQLSGDALKKTHEGSQAVDKVISSMNEISDSSNRIAVIIDVINSIAFQTNLLALNASIEAARAGEMGKGFAVVAVEVRKLAKRSDKAAAEISDIIKDSKIKVVGGVELANEAGNILSDIKNSVEKVTSLIAEISTASLEQISGVEQIDKTIADLDRNTQQNASMVEQAAAATEQLSAQANELTNKMSFFKISESSETDSLAIPEEEIPDQ